jgi:thiol-disulfide isomerase/thioredoxin
MRRPNLALSGIVLGLAVLVGCAKKPKSDSVASATPEPAANNPAPAPAKGQPANGTPAAGKTQPANNTPSLFAVTSDPSTPAPMGGAPMGGMPGGDSVAAAPRAVELIQCRFAKVEEALKAAKGKVVFVDCWARWCPPCLASFPELVKKHEKYGPKGLVCISVSLDAGRQAFNPDQVLSFLKEKNATFQNFYLSDVGADNATMEARFGRIEGIPHGVVFDKRGEQVWVGHPMKPEAVQTIEAELAK